MFCYLDLPNKSSFHPFQILLFFTTSLWAQPQDLRGNKWIQSCYSNTDLHRNRRTKKTMRGRGSHSLTFQTHSPHSFHSRVWRHPLTCVTSGSEEPDLPSPPNFLTSLFVDSTWRAVGHLHLVVVILNHHQEEWLMSESLQCRLLSSCKRKRVKRCNIQEPLPGKCLVVMHWIRVLSHTYF